MATMTREQEISFQGYGGAFMKATVNPMGSGCEPGDPNARSSRAGKIAGNARQPGTLKRDATARCRRRRAWRQANTLARGFALIIWPIGGSRYFGFISGGTGSEVLFCPVAGKGSNCQSESVYTVSARRLVIDFVLLFLPLPRYSPAIHHRPSSGRRWWRASGLRCRGRIWLQLR